MHSIINAIMLFLFVLFMIFIFGGYHKNKYKQREKQFKTDEQKKSNDEVDV